MTEQTASYYIGYALGTVTRIFLRAMRKRMPASTAATAHLGQAKQVMPAATYPSGKALEHICQVPAIVRRRGVDLNAWFEANTKEAQVKKPRRTRTRTPKQKPNAAAVPALRMGSLNELIAPVEPAMSC
ncbi:conserved hypothetical protein [Pseudomonas sp. 8Z]|uniref:hypothetical protein n=1 Tax=Pseudomonas sp. 8Z TaxID=2653166 RepID=UPI0012F3338A|nr:hypothetical protein [Pseudomonas sp. 8Z]VXC23971.1 conserved hypothetical protein [Pseudomonas sp. 8Z]